MMMKTMYMKNRKKAMKIRLKEGKERLKQLNLMKKIMIIEKAG